MVALEWRWCYWLYEVAIAVSLIPVLLGASETRFDRPLTALDGRVILYIALELTERFPTKKLGPTF
jgi:hypothetical protein